MEEKKRFKITETKSKKLKPFYNKHVYDGRYVRKRR